MKKHRRSDSAHKRRLQSSEQSRRMFLEPLEPRMLLAADESFTFSNPDDQVTLRQLTGNMLLLDANLANDIQFEAPTNSLTLDLGGGSLSIEAGLNLTGAVRIDSTSDLAVGDGVVLRAGEIDLQAVRSITVGDNAQLTAVGDLSLHVNSGFDFRWENLVPQFKDLDARATITINDATLSGANVHLTADTTTSKQVDLEVDTSNTDAIGASSAAALPFGTTVEFIDSGGSTNDVIKRNDGLSWEDDSGFAVGDFIQVSSSAANDGIFQVVAMTLDRMTVDSSTLTPGQDDANTQIEQVTVLQGGSNLTFQDNDPNPDTITRSGTRTWSNDGFDVNHTIRIDGTPDGADEGDVGDNDGEYLITGISADGLTITLQPGDAVTPRANVAGVTVTSQGSPGAVPLVVLDPTVSLRSQVTLQFDAVSGGPDVIRRLDGANWADFGFAPNQLINVDRTRENNGAYRIAAISGSELTLHSDASLLEERSSTADINAVVALPEGAEIQFNAAARTITRTDDTTFDWGSAGFAPGQFLTVVDTALDADADDVGDNDGSYFVEAVSGNVLTLAAGSALADETVDDVTLYAVAGLRPILSFAGQTITRTTGDWVTDGFQVGHKVSVDESQFNNGMRLRLVTLDGQIVRADVAERGAGYQLGDVLSVGGGTGAQIRVMGLRDETNPALGAFAVEHHYLDNQTAFVDTYSVKVTVSDLEGETTQNVSVGVRNVPPVLSPLEFAVLGEQVVLSGEITDRSELDGQTVQVDWGDGSDPEFLLIPSRHVRVDFDSDDSGLPLAPGTLVSDQLFGFNDRRGFTVSTHSADKPAMIFNTAQPTGGDFDLGTPNRAFDNEELLPGPGVGFEGGDVEAFQNPDGSFREGVNDYSQLNVLIISADGNAAQPNDDEAGGQLIFDFHSPVTMDAVELLDIDEVGGKVELFDVSGNRAEMIIPALGANTAQRIDMDPTRDDVNGEPILVDGEPVLLGAVTRMVVSLAGDGAVTLLEYTEVAADPGFAISHRYAGDVPRTAQVTVTDDDGGEAVGSVVIDVRGTPNITSDSAVSVPEGQSAVIDVQAFDPDGDTEGAGLTYRIQGGSDQDDFSIDANTGALSFVAPPQFAAPQDVNRDNVYELQVAVVDSTGRVGLHDMEVTVISAGLPSVAELEATSTGVVLRLNNELDTSVLNLYATGPSDLILQGAASGPVLGSLVVDAAATELTFIKSGAPLQPDTYTVTLRSGEDAAKSVTGELLDGNGDGVGGDDYVGTFTISPPAANAITVGLPDFVRGPGQDVNVPADETGIPISISNGAGVRNVELRIGYDPAMLSITGATAGAAMPAGSAVTLDTSTAGTAIVSFTSPVDLPDGAGVLANLQANVPTGGTHHLRQQVLDVHSVVITDAATNSLPALADDGLHVVSYFGDLSGNGRVNARDASELAAFAALLSTGFDATPLTDPRLLADISGNRRVNASDATRVARFAALFPVDDIPPIPRGALAGGGGAIVLDANDERGIWLPDDDEAGQRGGHTQDGQLPPLLSSAQPLPGEAVDEALRQVLDREDDEGPASDESGLGEVLEEAIERLFG